MSKPNANDIAKAIYPYMWATPLSALVVIDAILSGKTTLENVMQYLRSFK